MIQYEVDKHLNVERPLVREHCFSFSRRTVSILVASLFFILISCAQNESNQHTSEITIDLKQLGADTLKFTSGITAIFNDSNGNFWIGSQQEGLALYRGDSLTYFTVNEGLADNQVRSIQEDHRGQVLIETAKGVSRFNGREISSFRSVSNPMFPSNWSKNEHDLWFNAGIEEGVLKYNGNSVSYLEFPKFNAKPHFNRYSVTDIAYGKDNMVWFATYAGVIGYNGVDFTIINDSTLGFKEPRTTVHVRSVFEDSKGRLWIGNNGIGLLMKAGGKTVNFSQVHQLVDAKSFGGGDRSKPGTLEHVFVIAEAANGAIWFGDRDTGVWMYDGENMTNFTEKDGLSCTDVKSIYTEENGAVWVGMADGNLFQFNGKTFYSKL